MAKSPAVDPMEAAQALIDPVLFGQSMLGFDLWSMQKQILSALTRQQARVAVKACHSSSKTFTAAIAVVWFMTLYDDAIVITTAPTWHQVKDLLWKEIKAAAGKCKIALPPVFTTDWNWDLVSIEHSKHYATGISTKEPERIQGAHAPHVLIVIDEGPGVPSAIWIGIDGIRAGGDVRVLALGNPTITTGEFYQAFANNRSGWATYTIDAFDTPNLEGLTIEDLLEMEASNPAALYQNPRPYLTTRSWVVERYHEWGPDSPLYQSRVRGRFPTKGSDSLFSLSWVEEARYVTPRPGSHSLGVDVARHGTDYTSYTLLYGNEIHRMWRVQERDTVQTTGLIIKMFKDDPTLSITVDDVGVGGGVVDALRAANVPVNAFNAGNSPVYSDDVINRGSEAYWALSLALKDGEIAVGDDISSDVWDMVAEQLTGIDYKFTPKGKIAVLKHGKKEDRPSPDYGDSLNMAWEAHRLDARQPALQSLQIVPPAESMLSMRDRPGFWGGFLGRGQSSSPQGGNISREIARVNGQQTIPISDLHADPDLPQMGNRITALCPQCGDLATLTEIGRVADQRNYRIECPHCSYANIIRSKVEGRVR